MSTKKTTPTKKAPAKKKPNTKTPAAKKPATKSSPSVPITAVPFDTSYLGDTGAENTVASDGEDVALATGTWFAVTIAPGASKRFLHLLQSEEQGTFVLYMLADRDASSSTSSLRLPANGAFMRALVTGTLHVLGANKPLSRAQIAKHIGGHEPPPQQAKPPYT